jgi:hypothetical protein
MTDLDLSNHIDTLRILRDIRYQYDGEFCSTRAEVALLYKTDTTCTGFMGSNPDAQLQFAVENGLIPPSDI